MFTFTRDSLENTQEIAQFLVSASFQSKQKNKYNKLIFLRNLFDQQIL